MLTKCAALLAVMLLVDTTGPAIAGPPDTGASPTKVARDGWPDTRAGQMARGWVEAFGRGEPAMRAFTARAMTQKSLAQRSMDDRMTRYRELHEQYGRLTLAKVIASAPDSVSASLLSTDGEPHTFVFTLEPTPPHQLVSVMIRQMERHGHFDFGMFHH